MTQQPISLATPADTLAAVPALLGFTPENSVVALALAATEPHRRTVVALARIDSDGAEVAADQIATALARQKMADAPVVAVVLVAVADIAHTGAALGGIDALRAAFAAHNVDTISALHTYALAEGSTYTDLDHGTDGIITDTAANAVAATRAVVEGATIVGRRADITARFEPGDTRIEEYVGLYAAATMGEDFLPITFDELAAVIHAREIPGADLISRVALALATDRVEVRDAFLAMAMHGHQEAADAFTHIGVRTDSGISRAHALSIAAYFLYCTGNGAAANAAIEAVESTARIHGFAVPSFTALLTRALNAGMPPHEVAAIADAITPQYVAEHIGRVQSYR
ncbi:DUF4192 family protein [Rhodococcoides fascians]|uniref:DUF4192 family protein n=1 Tax=Rhodococcoides fascians TaxID=1828 RepID=UPI00055B0BF9|nr:DUF4192 family protein [Rhodococcus fascians]